MYSKSFYAKLRHSISLNDKSESNSVYAPRFSTLHPKQIPFRLEICNIIQIKHTYFSSFKSYKVRIFSATFLPIECCIYHFAVVNTSGQQRVPINHDGDVIRGPLIKQKE